LKFDKITVVFDLMKIDAPIEFKKSLIEFEIDVPLLGLLKIKNIIV
jgi:hypothetical protein